jgi:iron complex outermembrane receptor protein
MQTATSAVPASACSEHRANGGVLTQGEEKSKILRRALRRPSSHFRVFLCILSVLFLTPLTSYAQAKYPFDLPAQPLAESLRAVGHQTSTNVMFEPRLVKGLDAPALRAETTPTEAIRLLLAGTKLTALQTAADTILIQRVSTAEKSAPTSQAVAPTGTNGYTRLAQVESPQSTLPAAAAQNPDDLRHERIEVEEVVVTAQKRVERLQDVPVPVTAVTAQSLVQSNSLRLQDYYTKVPGVNVASNFMGAPRVTIRGLATSAGTNPTVGVAIDDVPFGSATLLGGGYQVPNFDPSDLTRLEVLRGPQGTLYGANSLGGLINYITVDPSTAGYSGRLEAGGSGIHNGSEVGYSVLGALNAPFTETAAIRASAFSRRDPGYIDNVRTGQDGINSADSSGGRLSMMWKPSDEIALKIGALLQDREEKGSSFVDGAALLDDLQQTALPDTGSFTGKIQAYSANLTAKLANFDLTAISGYSINDAHGSFDYTYALGGFAQSTFGVNSARYLFENRTSKFSQEVRLSAPIGQKVNWLLGVFYTSEHSRYREHVDAADGITGAAAGALLDLYYPTTYKEVAAFTNIGVQLTDRFDVQVGGRGIREKQHYAVTWAGPYVTQFLGSPSPLVPPEAEVSNNAFTYLLTPRFKVSSDLMLYARLASGYRPGGPNSNATIHVIPTYRPDKTLNYELGAKWDGLDGKLFIDGSVYYIDWKDVQITLRDPTTNINVTANAGRAKSQGAEVAIEARPLAGLRIGGWVAFNDASLTEDLPTGPAVGFAGDQLPFSAHLSGNLSVSQEFPFPGKATGSLEGLVTYVGDRKGVFRGAAFGVPLPRQDFPAYTQIDLRAGVTRGDWRINLFINNITDKRALLPSAASNPNVLYPIHPRSYGISVAREF